MLLTITFVIFFSSKSDSYLLVNIFNKPDNANMLILCQVKDFFACSIKLIIVHLHS